MTAYVIGQPPKWILQRRVEAMSIGFTEYISEDGTHCKQVWDDGFIEIFEITH